MKTSFGGGKTHDRIALWHICKQGRSIAGLERFVDLDALPNCTVAVAAIDGRDLDPENGIYHADTGITTYTLWGEIAYQIGGVAGYRVAKNLLLLTLNYGEFKCVHPGMVDLFENNWFGS